jgi:gamma-glutamyltranspeptidase/glutathione hydrolase
MKRTGGFVWLFPLVLAFGMILNGAAWAKPPVSGTHAMVASNHYLASEAGKRMLEKGGTAADAAVATAAVLGVAEPWFSNILGGGTWALYYDKKTDKVRALDGVGYAPTHATAEFFRNPDLASYGVHQAILPGAWDGWILLLKEHGKLSLKEILAPAIELAENGVAVSPDFAGWNDRLKDEIATMPDTAAVYFKNGKPYKANEIIYQKDLAKTYRSLVAVEQKNLRKGRKAALQAASDYFYRGPIARKIVDFSKKNGGLFELKDFEKFHAQFLTPIQITYRGLVVYQCPPNSQGITQLLALNILEGYDLKKMKPNDPDAIHLVSEAQKLAFADRYYHIGDPAFVKIPLDRLLSKEYAAEQRKRIDMNKVMNWPIPSGLNTDVGTTTFHIVDLNGNAIAVTTSLGSNFLVVPGTGIILNNRMPMFEIEEGNPNLVMPGKKVRHTSNPSMAFKDGKPFMLWGATGVDSQPQTQVWGFLNVVEWGMNPQESVDAGRIIITAFPATRFPHGVENELQLEPRRFPPDLVKALEAKGHKVVQRGTFGSSNMILRDPATGLLIGGAEPRSSASVATW